MEQRDKKQVSWVAMLSIVYYEKSVVYRTVMALVIRTAQGAWHPGVCALFVALFVDDCTYCLYQYVRGSVKVKVFFFCYCSVPQTQWEITVSLSISICYTTVKSEKTLRKFVYMILLHLNVITILCYC